MATLNSAMQLLVDDLQGKMTSSDPQNQLSGEQQILIATAISKLADYSTWEQALVAVVEQHLENTSATFSDSLSNATTAVTEAGSDITTSKDSITTQSAHLAQIPQVGQDVQTALAGLGDVSAAVLKKNLASIVRPVIGITPIDIASTVGDFARSPSVFAVYDSSGESWLVRPSYSDNAVAKENTRLEYLKLLADGSAKSTIASHHVHNADFFPNPTTFICPWGCSAILPLGTIADNDDIAYEVVYSTQTVANTDIASYGGIYCRSGGEATITKPWITTDAVADQWGFNMVSNNTWTDVSALYDNKKHCLVIVDSASSLLIEKYRDGNHTTSTTINNAAELQSYINAGDFTIVKFISHRLLVPYGSRRPFADSGPLDRGSQLDCYGFFGKVGPHHRMAMNAYNAHYRFTADSRLEPVNYIFSSSVNQATNLPGSADMGRNGSQADLRVAITDMAGATLGVYHYQSKADEPGTHAGFISMALMCMNPYSHVGILNDLGVYDTDLAGNYGISRTCRAF
jgi:hypothetical protein